MMLVNESLKDDSSRCSRGYSSAILVTQVATAWLQGTYKIFVSSFVLSDCFSGFFFGVVETHRKAGLAMRD